jgi:hypothetical protein
MSAKPLLTVEQQAELDRILAWVVETCLIMGAQRHTAYKVAGAFGEGVERAWLDRDKK